MISESKTDTARYILPGAVAILMLLPGIATSQVPVDENGVPLNALAGEVAASGEQLADAPLLSAGELEELAGPVALYPDDLLAIVLPASTYPLEIVQAARFLEQLAEDSSLKPDESWDESVTALLNYPEVIRMLDEDIDWTWRLGEAVIAQQEDLIAAIETFRDRAYAAGNLQSDENQKVSNNDGVIEIVPVNEELIYVPYYEPEEVVVYQPRRVYYYYPQAYPVYYYPYPVGHRFSSGYFWGVTTAFSIGWNNNYLHVYHPSYWGHPYYGRSYYSHYYRRPSINVYNTWYVNNRQRVSRYNHRDGDYWRPRYRSGARPQDQRVRNRHYAPQNRDNPRRIHAGNTRDALRARDNGRMQLGLRERSADVTNRNRTSVDRSVRTDRVRDTQTVRAAGQRQNRTARQRPVGTANAERVRAQRSANNSDNVTGRPTSRGSTSRFRNRQATGTVRAEGDAGRQQTARSAQQRRAPAANRSNRVAAANRPAPQRTRPQSNASRTAPTARQPAARAPVVRRPAATGQQRAPARQTTRRAASRSDAGSSRQSKQAPARGAKRERKRK